MLTERRTDIDILKGFGILSVIYYHIGLTNPVVQYIASFHMLLFFFTAGYFYKKDKLTADRTYLKKKARHLLVPYFVWCAIYTVLNFCLDALGGNTKSFTAYVWNFVESNLNFGATWFLISLFVCTVVSGLLIDKIKNSWLLFAASIVCAAIGYLGGFFEIANVFRWQQSLFSVPSFMIGYMLRNYDAKLSVKLSVKSVLLCPVLLAAGAGISVVNGMAVLSRMNFGKSAVLFYVGAIFSIVSWLLVSKFLTGCKIVEKILSFYGKNSIIVLITHQVILMGIQGVTKMFIPTDILRYTVVFLAVAAIECAAICIVNKTKLKVLF